MIKKTLKIKFIKKIILAFALTIGLLTNVNAENSMIKVNEQEAVNIKSGLDKNRDLLYVEFNANNWKKDADFFKDFGIKMGFPKKEWYEAIWNYDMFLDLMRDLVWIKKGSVSIFIKDLSNLNHDNKKVMCEKIIKCFKIAILPYWEGNPNTYSVVDCCPGMKPKKFNVYYT